MKTLFAFFFLVASLTFITACGQKGPLIIEQEQAAQQKNVQQGAAADEKWDTNEASLKEDE